jgi:hypothetical protein
MLSEQIIIHKLDSPGAGEFGFTAGILEGALNEGRDNQ